MRLGPPSPTIVFLGGLLVGGLLVGGLLVGAPFAGGTRGGDVQAPVVPVTIVGEEAGLPGEAGPAAPSAPSPAAVGPRTPPARSPPDPLEDDDPLLERFDDAWGLVRDSAVWSALTGASSAEDLVAALAALDEDAWPDLARRVGRRPWMVPVPRLVEAARSEDPSARKMAVRLLGVLSAYVVHDDAARALLAMGPAADTDVDDEEREIWEEEARQLAYAAWRWGDAPEAMVPGPPRRRQAGDAWAALDAAWSTLEGTMPEEHVVSALSAVDELVWPGLVERIALLREHIELGPLAQAVGSGDARSRFLALQLLAVRAEHVLKHPEARARLDAGPPPDAGARERHMWAHVRRILADAVTRRDLLRQFWCPGPTGPSRFPDLDEEPRRPPFPAGWKPRGHR